MSKQTTTSRIGHQGVNRLTPSCQGRWKKHRTKYGYDTARRLTNLNSPAGTFGYTYDGVKLQRVDELSLPNSAYITNTYDDVARLTRTALESSGNTNLDSYAYGYNQAGQRTNLTRTLGDFVSYTYDNEGELKTALGKEYGGVTNRWQEQFGYYYDYAGNLLLRTNNTLILPFEVSALNELLRIEPSGTLTVAGTTTSPATNVTVNTSNAVLYADSTFASTNQPWVDGSSNAFTAIAQDSHGRTSTNTVSLYIPAKAKYIYDLNGNLLSEYSVGGTTNRQFVYDDENELTSVYQTNNWRSDFVYDGKTRRRIERDYSWNGSGWVETNEIHFIYDGNVVIQERDINNLPKVTYTRGSDLSGSLQGAGGIGGLLARSDNTQMVIGSPTAHAYYHADGNGNVTMLINYLQAIEAKYLYDPFGNTLSLSGPLASANVYRFSSKEWNDNAGLYYYLYRFYDPNLQRWPNRDPIGEFGGFNLYKFAKNNPLTVMDINGHGPLPPGAVPFQPPPNSPGNNPVENPAGAPESPADGIASGLEMLGDAMDAHSENKALNQAITSCSKSPHSSSGSCSCCVMTLNRFENGPGEYYYTAGYGYVVNTPCSQAAQQGGISEQGSITQYQDW